MIRNEISIDDGLSTKGTATLVAENRIEQDFKESLFGDVDLNKTNPYDVFIRRPTSSESRSSLTCHPASFRPTSR